MRIGDAFRFNGKHTCGARFSVFAKYVVRACGPFALDIGKFKLDYMWEDADGKVYPDRDCRLMYRCACGKDVYAAAVLGKHNPGKVCNTKCQASIGHQCECSCGGKNHGAGHEVQT